MKGPSCGALIAVVLLAGVAHAQSAQGPVRDRDRLIGAWHLVHIESPGQDAKPGTGPEPKGMLVYTADGHISVQLMYPKAAGAVSNEYVRNGYEASFGTYTLDEADHIATHHIEASVTGDLLIGKDLRRAYTFTKEGHLILRSAQPDEHWFVVWEHD